MPVKKVKKVASKAKITKKLVKPAKKVKKAMKRYEEVDGKKYYPSKLKKHVEDKRDFRIKNLMGMKLGAAPYVPKRRSYVIPTLSTKDQHGQNTCTQESATLQKEVDEGMVLSEQSLTCAAKEEGVISGNGFSSLREIQKVMVKRGIAKKSLLDGPDDNWEKYSSANNLTKEVREDALKHRSQSFFLASSKDEALAALDNKKVLHIGGDWYGEYNMSNGFAYPWIINKTGSYLVGGHATAMVGYIFGYKGIGADKRLLFGDDGKNVYVVKNSYSEGWGATFIDEDGVEHKGCFFITMDFFHKNWGWAFATVDITVDVASFLNSNQYAFVKGSTPAIYMIWGNKKHPFKDWVTFLAYEGRKEDILEADDNIINAIETGEYMDITGAPQWGLVRELSQPDNYKLVLENAKLNS